MANQWFKFYGGEYLSDPKVRNFSPSVHSCWLHLLSFAASATKPGVIEHLTESSLMVYAGIDQLRDEWKETIGVLQVFEKLEMIKIKDEKIFICNWNKRQQTFLTNAERQAKYRENHENKRNNSNAKVTQVLQKGNARIDKNRIDKNRIDKNRIDKKLPDWLDKEIWKEWEEYRKDKKKTLSTRSIELQLKELEKNIPQHKAIIEQSIRQGWTGLFPLKNEGVSKVTKTDKFV